MKIVMTQTELKEMIYELDINDNFIFALTSRTQEGMEEIMDSSNIYTSLFPETVANLDSCNTDDTISEIIELGAKLGYIYGFIEGAKAHVEEYIESEEYTDYLFEQAGIC